MKGITKEYYSLFLKAKESYSEPSLSLNLGSDPSNYENIYKKIQDTLESQAGIGIDSLKIRLQLTIEEKIDPKKSSEIRESLQILGTIRDAVNGKVFDFSNTTEWKECIQYSLLFNNNRTNKVTHGVPDEYNHIAEALYHLKGYGFTIESIDGYIKEDDTELKRLTIAIDYRASKLGKQGLFTFSAVIANRFSSKDLRFFLFRRRSTMPTLQEPFPPYGYLFNLFCKYTGKKSKFRGKVAVAKIDEIRELSTHLGTIHDFDKMSPWANINVSSEDILEKLREWVVYPEVFYIPQISPIHGKSLFPKIFELIPTLSSNCKDEISKTTAILQRIEDKMISDRAICGELSEQDIFNLCSDIVSREKLSKVLEKISTPSNKINRNYKSPLDATKSNIKEIPLIKSEKGYIVANLGTYNISVYRTLLNIAIDHHPKAEQKFGFAIEEFIKEKLKISNVNFNHSFKYTVPGYIRDISKTNRHEGECDFIIESSEYIFLIEVKKKGITKGSWSGDIVNLLTDTALSFVKSLNQLSIAELMLLNDKKIISKNGDTVELQNRDIFKLAISFEDMASLQTDSIKNSLLRGLFNTNINTTDNTQKHIIEINKTLDEFTLIHGELFTKEGKYENNPFHDISYISTPQLLTILEDTNNNEEFAKSICRSNTVVLSLMDWYASYKSAKTNKLIEENPLAFKHTALIN